jgi:hypothetical protein
MRDYAKGESEGELQLTPSDDYYRPEYQEGAEFYQGLRLEGGAATDVDQNDDIFELQNREFVARKTIKELR